MSEIKSKTIFDFLNDLSFNKILWKDQLESDRKKFQPYMINRWLSMHPDYLDLVAECQSVTNNLSAKEFYSFYLDLLPKKKFFTKYISSKTEKDPNRKKLISFMADKIQGSESEMEEYLEILMEQDTGYTDLKSWLKLFGYGDKEIKKEFGL